MAGVSTNHEVGHALNWPNGTEYWLVMGFQTPFIILDDEGKLRRGKPGDYIIQPPHTPLYHTDVGEGDSGFKNDWIIIYAEGFDELIRRLDLPINKIFSLADQHFLRHYLKKLISECRDRPIHFELRREAIITEMMIMLKRALSNSEIENKESYERIAQSREQMLQSYDKNWTLTQISDLAGISPSRFISLYKKYYGTSPINDLILRRLDAAKALMITSSDKLETIAKLCGFSSIHYFSNCFKKHESISPTKWREGNI